MWRNFFFSSYTPTRWTVWCVKLCKVKLAWTAAAFFSQPNFSSFFLYWYCYYVVLYDDAEGRTNSVSTLSLKLPEQKWCCKKDIKYDGYISNFIILWVSIRQWPCFSFGRKDNNFVLFLVRVNIYCSLCLYWL